MEKATVHLTGAVDVQPSPAGIGVYIGRFCPVHIGHSCIIDYMQKHHRDCLLLIGSCNSPLSWRVLFTYSERKKWIETVHPALKVMGIPDVPESDDVWFDLVTSAVRCVFPNTPDTDVEYLGGSYEDVKALHDRGARVKVFDRTNIPVSASAVRQLLLMNLSTDKIIDSKVESQIRLVFQERIEQLDNLRNG